MEAKTRQLVSDLLDSGVPTREICYQAACSEWLVCKVRKLKRLGKPLQRRPGSGGHNKKVKEEVESPEKAFDPLDFEKGEKLANREEVMMDTSKAESEAPFESFDRSFDEEAFYQKPPLLSPSENGFAEVRAKFMERQNGSWAKTSFARRFEFQVKERKG